MNKLVITQIQHLSSPACNAHFEDEPLIDGIADSHQIAGKKLVKSVPLRLACVVLRLCRMAGMTQAQFGSVVNRANEQMGKVDGGRAWQRYFPKRQPGQTWVEACANPKKKQFSTAKFRAFVIEAKKRGWLDQREKPALPHPIETGWGKTSADAVRQWTTYELPLTSSIILERLDAIDACVNLLQSGKTVTLEAVRQESIVGISLEKANRRDTAGHGQRARRAREKLVSVGKDVNMHWVLAPD